MYFEERLNEKEEDPLKDIVTFKFPWFITLPSPDENNDFTNVWSMSRTKYKFHSATWFLYLKRSRLSILDTSQVDDDDDESIGIWDGTCFCSYNLYSDTEKRLLLYSSPRIEMINWEAAFMSPEGFTTKFDEAITENRLKKMDVFIELRLPAKYFYRPFEMPSCQLSRFLRDEYPTDMENDFRLEFMQDSDFVIKCPDGEMPAMRIVLNNACEVMHEYFNTSNINELAVYHSIDVVKPIIICLHTRYFQMPKSYDLDYAKRLLMAMDFFNPNIGFHIETSIHLSLCLKFVEEKHSFNSILQWLKIAYHQRFRELETMINTVIADKFYYEWHQTFPDGDASNEENQIFLDIFGRRSTIRVFLIFSEINYNMRSSLITNVILD